MVRGLLPPMVREEVAGDLSERFSSSSRYFGEALVTLPYILFSQMRRATSGPMLLLEAFIVFASLGGFQPTDLTRGPVPASASTAIATIAGLVALLLRDAYRTTNRWTVVRALYDLVALVLAIMASQAVLMALAHSGLIDSSWRMPGLWLFGGMVFALTMLFILRTGVDLVGAAPWLECPDANAADLCKDYAAFRSKVVFKNSVETIALTLLVAVAFWFDLHARPVVAGIGFTWIGLTLLLMTYNLTRGRVSPMDEQSDIGKIITQYRKELDRQRRAIRFVWWWYFVALFAGLFINLLIPGIIQGRYVQAIAGVACILLLAYSIIKVNKQRRVQLADKIAALDRIVARSGQ
ncbi:MAG: hypothetical protein ABI616_07940 [Pseudomonadota bacterium]